MNGPIKEQSVKVLLVASMLTEVSRLTYRSTTL